VAPPETDEGERGWRGIHDIDGQQAPQLTDDPLPGARGASAGSSVRGLTRRRASGAEVPEPARAPSPPAHPGPVADDSGPVQVERSTRVHDRSAAATTAATIVLVTAGLGVVAAIASRPIIGGWSSNPREEALILSGMVIAVVAAGWVVILLGIAASLRVVEFFVVPLQPPGLARINALIEQIEAEQDAAPAKHPREPLPPIIASLRAIASNRR
jgi:hypothetical protein